MKYIYGLVRSRRLGLSLGVTLTPYKICNFDCVYCQLGQTKELTLERKEYIKADDVIAELSSWLKENPAEAEKLNYITLSGLGEPTLNIKIGEIISRIKKITPSAISVITNSSLLVDSALRCALLEADLIVPSLDAVVPEVFMKVNRPHQDIKIECIINGLVSLRKEFRGKIWLEVMLVSGVNDDLRYIKKLKEVTEMIKPDKIQVNSPVRSSSDQNVSSVDMAKLEKIREILGDKCQII
jgi:wyosine [tRNA(Phe)-imidazoG37] synthetase (radical SAM superfamily)